MLGLVRPLLGPAPSQARWTGVEVCGAQAAADAGGWLYGVEGPGGPGKQLASASIFITCVRTAHQPELLLRRVTGDEV